MADEDIQSPAVISLELEQAEQRFPAPDGDLDKALEDTFPASDPVSMTSTVVPGGRSGSGQMEQERARDTSGAGAPGNLIDTARGLVRENPLRAVGIVALLAFVYGTMR